MTTHYMEEAQDGNAGAELLRFLHVVGGHEDGGVELRADSGRAGATLDELFALYTGESLEAAGAYDDTANARRAGQRLG